MRKWVPSWNCVAIDYHHPVGHVEDITQTGIFLNNVDGDKVRLRLNNFGGEKIARTIFEKWFK